MEIRVMDDTGERFALKPEAIEAFLDAEEYDLPTHESEAAANRLSTLVDMLQTADAIYRPAGLWIWVCGIDEMEDCGFVIGVCREPQEKADGSRDWTTMHPIIVEGYDSSSTIIPEDQAVNRDDVSAWDHARSMLEPILDTANGVIERCAQVEPWSQTESADR